MLWKELTSPELKKACAATGGTCLLPFGVLEKHGSHLPLGTDMFTAETLAQKVAEIEPAVVFPIYYFGQINEARHMAGTIAISPELMYRLLDEVCREIARNGFKKIAILNMHGGNPHFLRYFIQCMLYEKKDYAVYLLDRSLAEEDAAAIRESLHQHDFGEHAGNLETSNMMAIRPDLVRMEAVEKGHADRLGRLDRLKPTYTSVWWYADHPTHFAGDPGEASAETGRKALMMLARKIAEELKAVKEDDAALRLQAEFFKKS